MINIIEDKSYKLPFDISLFITFDYNQEIISFLNTLEVTRYNKKNNTWEIPCTDLAKVIDTLCYYDDISITFLNQEENSNIVLPNAEYKTTPFPYQLDGITYGLNHNRWLLLDAPGLGKTLQLTYLAEELYKNKDLKHCLIICGINELKSNWKKEILKHSELSCKILGERVTKTGNVVFGSVAERIEQLKNPIDEFFIITNKETFRNEKAVEAAMNGSNDIGMIVIDEIHKIKDPNSISGSNILKLQSKYMIGATGTLIVNNPLDAFVPLKWTGNISTISVLTDFKKYFCNMTADYMVTGFKNLDILKELIEKCSLRRTKDLVDLPEKTIIDEYVEMSEEHRKFYESIKEGIKSEADKIVLKPQNLRAMATRLRQATACPSILTTQHIKSSKVERAVDLTEQLVSSNEKVVIFATYKESIYQLKEQLKSYNPIVVTGDTTGDIAELVSEFQNNPERKIFIATWQKMGTGFTLNAASYMIFIDTPYTDSDYLQAQDRIHRIGSKKPVFIYNLICESTFDVVVKSIISKKQELSDCLTGDIPSEVYMKEILNLLTD